MADRAEIRAQLEGLEPRAAAVVALRAAMRVLPVLARRRQQGDEPFDYWAPGERSRHVLNILRCYQISIFGNNLPKIDAATASSAAAAAHAAAVTSAADTVSTAGFATALAAPSAAPKVTAATASAAARATANAATAIATVYAAEAVAEASAAARASAAAFSNDLLAARSSGDMRTWLTRPLWPEGMPKEIDGLWRQLQQDLLARHDNFDVWINWYRARLRGHALDMELERKWALLPDEVLDFTPAEINIHLERLAFDDGARLTPDDPDEPLRDIPEEQEPGLQFAAAPDGRIDLKPSGIVPPDDLAEIAAMRGAICEALDDLASVLEGSNAHSTIVRVATRYKTAINADELSIDLLYSYGVRLENANMRFKAEIASGDSHDLAVPGGEALDSVLALHGPVVYSTERGRELIERAREYARREADEEAYKAKAQVLAEAIQAATNAITEGARDAINQANADIGYGPHPERSTEVARSANQNIIITGAKALAMTVGVATLGSVLSEATIAGAPHAWLAIETFFIRNMPLLREFAIIPGFEIRWLPAFLNWLEVQRVKRK